jgi:TP901 family phage tail tape measure protein
MAQSATVGILRVLLTGSSAELEATLKKSNTEIKRFTKELGTFGQQAQALGASLTKAVTLPLVAFGAAAIKAASDFESSFAGVRKTVDGTVDQFGELTEAGKEIQQAMRDMAKEIPINVNELNKVAESAGALGIRKDDIVEFTETMAILGVTTNLTADEAATATARIQNIFGAAGKDVDRFAATLVGLGNDGASTEKEIIEMGLRIAGAGKQIGLSQAEVLAFSNALSSVGINAEAGGSSISKVFLKMKDAVMEGGDGLAEWARVAGMSVDDFKKKFETDAGGAVVAFVNGLQRLGKEGENINQTMEGLVGRSIITKDTLNRLAGAGDLLAQSLANGNRFWQENSAHTKEAEQRFRTFESQLILFKNKLQDVGITVGTALLPMMQDLLKAAEPLIGVLKTMAEWFAGLPEPVRQAALAIGALAASIGPLTFVFGSLTSSIAGLIRAFTEKGLAMRALVALQPMLVTGLTNIGTAMGTLGGAATNAALAIRGMSAAWLGLMGLGIAAWFTGIIAVVNNFNNKMKEENENLDKRIEAYKVVKRPIKDLQDALEILAVRQAGLTGQTVQSIRVNGEAIKFTLEHAAVYQRAAEEAKGLQGATKGLTVDVDKAAKSLRDHATGANQSKAAQQDLTAQLAAVQREVRELTDEQKRNIEAGIKLKMSSKEIAEELKKLNIVVSEAAIDQYTAQFKRLEDQQEKTQAAAEKTRLAQERFAASARSLTQDTWEPFKVAIEQTDEELDNLAQGFRADGTLIVSSVDEQKEASDRAREAWKKWFDAGGLLLPVIRDTGTATETATGKTEKWTESIGGLVSAFGNLSQIEGGLGEVAGAIADTLGALDLGIAAGESFLAGMNKALVDGASKGAIAAGVVGIITSIISGIGGIANATSSANLAKNIVGGMTSGAAMGAFVGMGVAMASGAKIGMMAGGIWGAVAGAIIGIIVGIFRGRDTRRQMEQVGRDWGVSISEGMAASIQMTASSLFGGNVEAARVFNLKPLIESAGGLNELNFSRFTGKLRDVFVMVQRGLFQASQARQVLDENWAAFVRAGTDASGRLSPALQEIIRLNDQMGIRSKAIAEYLQGQGTIAIEGFNTVVAGMPAVWGEVGARVDAARQKLDELKASSDGTPESLEAIKNANLELFNALQVQGQEAARNKAELADLGLIAVGTFAAAIAAGQSFGEALKTASPGLTALRQAYKDLGLDIEDAGLSALLMQNDILTKNPQLIAGIGGLSQSFIALSNMGLLNVDTFRAMERQGLQMYSRVQGQVEQLGGTSRDALLPMQGFLQEAAKQARLLGIPLDSNLQNLIDQSVEFGIWKDAGEDAVDPVTGALLLLVEKMERFIELLEDTGGAARNMGDEGDRAARKMADSIRRNAIPAVTDLGDEVDGVIQQSSPTGLEGIIVYAGYAADAIRDMARESISALMPLGSIVSGVAVASESLTAAFQRITSSNIGRQLTGLVNNIRQLETGDLGTAASSRRGFGTGLVDKVTALSRAVQLAGAAEGMPRDLLNLRFQMGDEIRDLGPDPVLYRREWERVRGVLGDQLRFMIEDLEFAREDQIRALGPVPELYGQQYEKGRAKAQKALDKSRKSIDENQARELKQLQDNAAQYGRGYTAARQAVIAEFDEMRVEAQERYDAEIEQLGPLPSEYEQIYEEALRQVDLYYDRMTERAKAKHDEELAAIGPVPDEYERIYGEAVELVKAKYKAMVDAAAEAAKATVDAWAIVRQMFAAIATANPNVIVPPPGATSPPTATPTTAPETAVPIDEVVRELDSMFMAERGRLSTAEERAMFSRYIGYTGASTLSRTDAARAKAAVHAYLTQGAIPHLATGGVVRLPTLAMVGERGPEVIQPVSALEARDRAVIKEIAGLRADMSTDRAALRRDLFSTLPGMMETAARHGAQTSGRRR